MTVIDTPYVSVPGSGILRPVFNVKDYGAVGDGVANDTTAIQSALTAAGVSGGYVFLPRGTYLVNSPLTIASLVYLRGSGHQNTKIKLNFNGTLFDLTNMNGGGFEDLYIQGSGAGVAGTSAIGFNFNTTTRVHFRRVYLDNLQGGKALNFNAGGSFEVSFLQCTFAASIPLFYINNTGPVHFLACQLLTPSTYSQPGTICVRLDTGHGTIDFVSCLISSQIAGGQTIYSDGAQLNLIDCYIGDAGTGATLGINFDVNSTKATIIGGSLNGFDIGLRFRGADHHVFGLSFNVIATTLISNLSAIRCSAIACPGYNPGVGTPSLVGIDNRSGVTVADGSPIVLYAVPAGANQLFDAAIEIDATAFTSGTATYTMTYTENGVSQTVVVTATAINVVTGVRRLIQPDASTNVTVQLTGAFVATCRLSAALMQLA